ncbi:MAG: discoidin domain-containing protein [Acidobacteria bacterium]|nr:discoidin domain-containing protein [Acidobacteriota bacterium]
MSLFRILPLSLLALATVAAQEYTRGVGVYPGDPRQDFSPRMEIDSAAYRNVALRRPVYQSSSYDYNLTGQLVTDGIHDSRSPRWLRVSTSTKGVLGKIDRELLLDGNWVTTVDQRGPSVWVQIEIAGDEVPEVNRIDVDGTITATPPDNQEWTCTILGSGDGATWKQLGQATGMAHPTGEIHPRIALPASRSRYYRLRFDTGRNVNWSIGEISFWRGASRVPIGGPYEFNSAWKSAGAGEEWLYVDLGAACRIDRVKLDWIRRAAKGEVQVSADARTWKGVHALDSDDIHLAQAVEARYVRLLLEGAASPEGYVLSELEVYGRGGPVPRAHPVPAATAARTDLAGGRWKVQRDSLVSGGGVAISRPGFDDSAWTIATVPGTVLASYLNAGAIPDPDFGDNQLAISDSFFHANFWYRDEFPTPPGGKHTWLNFDGINWKADVYLNGEELGRIEGAFQRARFEVTGKLRASGNNALAVLIYRNDNPGVFKEKTFDSPGKNGGVLGADNPTFHASIGWDWIPTIHGRDTGIWNNVFLATTGDVTVEQPVVRTTLPLPDTSRAEIEIEATLHNHSAVPVTGHFSGRFGDHTFEVPVRLAASESLPIKHHFTLEHPKLWWPNGYGDPNLYDVELRFGDSDTVRFQTGVRQFTWSEDNHTLRMWINGRRFIARGGNWGFSESMLRYRAREYETAMRLHRDQHFNMVRNWVGQVGEDAFYDAADRNGIVIMQDFWLANPWDGPDPDDNPMFVRNARDTVLRIRNHPSIGLYCGRNEGYPLKPLDDSIRALLAELHPGIPYIPSSADDVVSGHGPYRAMTPEFYFQQRATPKFHSELGMPNIVTMDSLRAMMPESGLWPQGDMWGKHDFSLNGAQGGSSFRERIEKSYGGASDAATWVSLAQFVNYEGYRAMFEAQGKNRMGLLIWMSHPTWPSMVWETYDYYFEPSAAYFGAKKAAEPLHIQWNPVANTVEVVNYSAGNQTGLTAHIEIRNLDGSLRWQKTAALDSREDSIESPIHIEYPAGLSAVHFIRLKLTRGAETVSENFYWHGTQTGDYRALRTLGKAAVKTATRTERSNGEWILTTELENTSTTPALMTRVKVVRQKSGDRILPAIYSDNYVALMPGEHRTIRTVVENADTRGESPRIVLEGFNVTEQPAN